MRELVDENELRPAREGRVDVELRERALLVVDLLAGKRLESLEERGGLAAPMRFHDAHHDIPAIVAHAPRGEKHRVRLPDASRGPEEYLQASTHGPQLLALHAGQQGVGIGACLGHGAEFRRFLSRVDPCSAPFYKILIERNPYSRK